jgi:hypothetical protein
MVHSVFADHDAGGNNSVVECDLAKVEVAGSNPVSRSNLALDCGDGCHAVAAPPCRRALMLAQPTSRPAP